MSVAPSTTRRLGLYAASAIVIANMIGTGVFSTLSFQVHALPDERAILLLWLLGGLSALAGAFCYAELGAARPRSGGEYALLTQLFHPATGFVSGWISIVAGFAAPIAAAALAFGAYLGKLSPALAPHELALAIGLVLLVTAVHCLRVDIGARFQIYTTAFKLALMLGIVAAALWVAPAPVTRSPELASLIGSPAFAVSLVYVSYAYFGWNAALYVAGEVRDPARNLPRALILSTLLVTALYLAVNWAFLRLVPFAELVRVDPTQMTVENELAVGFLAGHALFGEHGGQIVGSLIALALVSTVSAMIMAGPRVLATMAEDWRPFALFARRSHGGAPLAALGFQAVLVILFLATASFEFVVNFIGVSLSLFNMAVIAGFLRERSRRSPVEGSFRAPFGRTAATLFLLINGWMVVFLCIEQPWSVALSVASILVALGLWWPLRRHAPGTQP